MLTFGAYALDKLRATRRRRRIPEARLLWLSLPGTAAGAWLAVLLLRHKTRKPAFLLGLALVTALQAALVWGAARTTAG